MLVSLSLCVALVTAGPATPGDGPPEIQAERVLDPQAGPVADIDLSQDGARLLVGCRDGRLFLYELDGGTRVAELTSEFGRLSDVEFDQAGDQVLGVFLGGACLWDARSLEPRQRWTAQQQGMALGRFSPDGRQVATCPYGSGKEPERETFTRLWNAESGELLATFGGTGAGISLEFHPDGTALLVTSGGRRDGFIHPTDGRSEGSLVLEGHSGGIAASTWSPDGKTVLTASVDRSARLWSAARGRELRKLRGHSGYLSACAFSPDGALASTTSWEDRTTRIWSVENGKQRLELSGHAVRPTRARFAPDGRAFASVDVDGVGLVFELKMGRCVGRLTGHVGPLGRLEFTPDSRRLVTAGEDGTVRVWRNPAVDSK